MKKLALPKGICWAYCSVVMKGSVKDTCYFEQMATHWGYLMEMLLDDPITTSKEED